MAVTSERLDQAQKQILILFRRPVTLPDPFPDYLKGWDRTKRVEAELSLPEAYIWGLKNIEGVAVSQVQGSEKYIELDVAVGPPPVQFQKLLAVFFADIPYRVVVTGRFQAIAGVGSNISLSSAGAAGGKIALFVKDSHNPPNQFALTCAHVLDAAPNHQPVYSGPGQLGILSFRVAIHFQAQANPNHVDCALAGINGRSLNNNLPVPPASGGFIAAVDSAALGDSVKVVNKTKNATGTIQSIQATLRVYYPYDTDHAWFENVITVTPATGSQQVVFGDSGSPLLSSSNKTVGMVIAISETGGLVVACHMQLTLTTLGGLVGSTLSPV